MKADVHASISAFDDTSMAQRLSRLFSLQISDYLEFDPFVIRAEKRRDDVVSACLWVSELQDLEILRSWVLQWQGPVSLLVTTTAEPRSGSLATLLHRLHTLVTDPLPGLSVHLLRTGMREQASSNSYLNLARFFAPTSLNGGLPGATFRRAFSHNHNQRFF
ncbi:hypothetical protein H2248_004790 [Termitomyces sp. 'cryptogamus']|nr:hypothetical protein H2248_004790 [Termitomyces sp. 'cryptogamus']